MSLKSSIADAIRDHVAVPEHIKACAGACLYDLMHGPSFVRIPAAGVEAFTRDDLASDYASLEEDKASAGGIIAETYTSPVAEAVRTFITDLPSELWVDDDCGSVSTAEPEAYEDDGEMIEPDLSNTYKVESRDIVEALFGATFAKEFN